MFAQNSRCQLSDSVLLEGVELTEFITREIVGIINVFVGSLMCKDGVSEMCDGWMDNVVQKFVYHRIYSECTRAKNKAVFV